MLPTELKGLSEAALDRELLRRGMGFVTDDPGRYVRLSLSRAVEYFKFWPSADSSPASNAARVLSFGLLLPFLVGGILITFRAGSAAEAVPAGAGLLLMIAGIYSLLHLLTWTLVRYRLPVDAMVMPFAGVALVAAWARFRRAAELRRLTPGTETSS
jgi:hypothetical protein